MSLQLSSAVAGRAGTHLALRDRAWLGVETVRVVGPLDRVSAGALRTALLRLAASRPDNRLVTRLDRAAARWIPLGASERLTRVSELVLDELAAESIPPSTGSLMDLALPVSPTAADALAAASAASADGFAGVSPAADALARRLAAEALGDRPAVFAVAGGYAGMKISHAVGDGRVANVVFPELLTAAAQGVVPKLSFARPARYPVVRAALRHFGAAPARLVEAVRVVRPPVQAVRQPHRPEGSRPASAHRAARSTPETSRRLRAWRAAHAPDVSMAAVLLATVSAAFMRCGLGLAWPGAVVLVDVRRYLPPESIVDGNFVWGLYVVPTNLTDPYAIHRALSAELAGGRAIAMLAMRNLGVLLGRGSGGEWGEAAPHSWPQARPELTFTHLGRLSAYERLPWAAGPDERRWVGVFPPAGPRGVTVSAAELGGALHLCASFHRSTFDPAAVAEAVELAAANPLDLLDEAALD